MDKSIVWVFGTPTLQLMIADLDSFIQEGREDEHPSDELDYCDELRSLLAEVLLEKEAS